MKVKGQSGKEVDVGVDIGHVNLCPARNCVLVKPLPAKTVTEGGIVLPDSSHEKVCRGRPIACGVMDDDKSPFFTSFPSWSNSVVIWREFAGVEIEHDGETYLLIRAEDLVALIED